MCSLATEHPLSRNKQKQLQNQSHPTNLFQTKRIDVAMAIMMMVMMA